jgi:hypothetical protein
MTSILRGTHKMKQTADIAILEDAYAANERDARQLIDGVTEPQGVWRPAAGSWSIAECLDHLAVGNRVYLASMEPAAVRARRDGHLRRRPATPGLFGGWFVRTLEPPVTWKTRAPRKIVPRESPPLADAAAAFFASHERVARFLAEYADIDLPGVRFPNPFVRAVHFSLATGLHVLAAHERRHLWQAWNVRRQIRVKPEATGR